MRIAILSYWTCPLARPGVLTAGGLNVYVKQLANALGVLDLKVDIFTRSHQDVDKEIIDLHKNVRVIHVRSSHKDPYKDLLEYSNRVTDFIQKNELSYSLIHAHYFYSGLIGLHLKKQFGIPLVLTFHTTAILKKIHGATQDLRREKSERLILKNTDKVIVFTMREKQDLIKYYGSNKNIISVIPPGVNHALFHPHNKIVSRGKLGMEMGKKVILFVGRIDPIKGITFLIKSISYLVAKYPEFNNKFLVFIMGGDVATKEFQQNSEVVRIKNLIIKKKLDCCIRFISSQPHNLLPVYYSAADLVVMPSVYESFGLVVLEAMATGTAVVATRVGGLQYLVTDKVNGRLFESRNIDQLAEIIWELLHDDLQRMRLGKSARVQSMNFCWNTQAKKIVRTYQKLL